MDRAGGVQMALEHVEIGLEISDGEMVRVLVFNPEAAAHVDVFHLDSLPLQAGDAGVDPVAERDEVAHLQDLGADVEVQAAEVDVRELQRESDGSVQLRVVDPELVLREAGGDVRVGMRAYVRIDPETDRGGAAHGPSYLVDNHQFSGGFHVEAADPGF